MKRRNNKRTKNQNTPMQGPVAPPEPKPVPAPRTGTSRVVELPANAAEQRRQVKEMLLNVVGGAVLTAQMRPFAQDGAGTGRNWAEVYVEALRESVRPRDALEEMLVLQMAWAHARLARLSIIAHDQEQRANVQVVHDACDRAANTFRKQMLALAEYRRPAQIGNFVAIRQANLANQQVVQNVENSIRSPDSRMPDQSNEQGSPPAALSPVGNGIGLPAINRAQKQAVAAEHRPQDGGGQGALPAERDEARRA